ncbi:hypothetical protein EGH25_10860 [Haladaptatus sp. F3-133]|uniref:Uncharacterized protein n=1 Tax=Halorutilus salinus TaxID=2487751 RepID=A0A9Q4C640_9EURY|nr:hypothetical protein [Halorutilus salinus]MCX2819850.1 hypothetical protein [Halorutilus salinus]
MSAETEEEFDEEDLPDACLGTLNSIRSYSTKPGRTVFVEQGNPDGWISTDETAEVLK